MKPLNFIRSVIMESNTNRDRVRKSFSEDVIFAEKKTDLAPTFTGDGAEGVLVEVAELQPPVSISLATVDATRDARSCTIDELSRDMGRLGGEILGKGLSVAVGGGGEELAVVKEGMAITTTPIARNVTKDGTNLKTWIPQEMWPFLRASDAAPFSLDTERKVFLQALVALTRDNEGKRRCFWKTVNRTTSVLAVCLTLTSIKNDGSLPFLDYVKMLFPKHRYESVYFVRSTWDCRWWRKSKMECLLAISSKFLKEEEGITVPTNSEIEILLKKICTEKYDSVDSYFTHSSFVDKQGQQYDLNNLRPHYAEKD